MSLHDLLRKASRIIPDEMYLRLKYFWIMKKPLHLNNPRTFNEKIQWLKIYDRDDIYHTMVDKYDVKQYVANIIGEAYIIPTYGTWDSFDEIEFEKLPNQFVLKCTHDSGGLVVVRDKNTMERKKGKEKIEKSLKQDFFWIGREWQYKGLKPRIIAEQYLDAGKEGIIDYKFYCFNGEPKYLYVSQGLENHATARISFLTVKWELAKFGRSDYKPFEKIPEKPANYDEMLEIARMLSKGIRFIRVDLYSINGKTYFSELTLSPCSGFMPFDPDDWDLKLGKELKIC